MPQACRPGQQRVNVANQQRGIQLLMPRPSRNGSPSSCCLWLSRQINAVCTFPTLAHHHQRHLRVAGEPSNKCPQTSRNGVTTLLGAHACEAKVGENPAQRTCQAFGAGLQWLRALKTEGLAELSTARPAKHRCAFHENPLHSATADTLDIASSQLTFNSLLVVIPRISSALVATRWAALRSAGQSRRGHRPGQPGSSARSRGEASRPGAVRVDLERSRPRRSGWPRTVFRVPYARDHRQRARAAAYQTVLHRPAQAPPRPRPPPVRRSAAEPAGVAHGVQNFVVGHVSAWRRRIRGWPPAPSSRCAARPPRYCRRCCWAPPGRSAPPL